MKKPITIKEVSQRTGLSAYAVRDNIRHLLRLLSIEERIKVLEHMLFCREMRNRKVVVDEVEVG